MASPDQIEVLRFSLKAQLSATAIDAFPSVRTVTLHELLEEFRFSRKRWFQLCGANLLEVGEIRVDDFDFSIGTSGACYDLEEGRVEIVEFSNPMVNIILRAWD